MPRCQGTLPTFRALRACAGGSPSLHLLPPGSPPGRVAGRGLQPRTKFRIWTAERLQERLFKTGGASGEAPPFLLGAFQAHSRCWKSSLLGEMLGFAYP